MSKPEKVPFTQDNVNAKIKEIKALPDPKRMVVANEIKRDLRKWLLKTFTFTTNRVSCMEKWPLSMREETGFGIGTALQYPEWNLIIEFPEGPEPPEPTRKKDHEQSVSGSYSPQTGAYTVTKKHTWKW